MELKERTTKHNKLTSIPLLNFSYIAYARIELGLGLFKLGERVREMVEFLLGRGVHKNLKRIKFLGNKTHLLQLLPNLRELGDIEIGDVYRVLACC